MSNVAPDTEEQSPSRSAERVLQILELVAASAPPIGLPAIATQTGIAKSTAHRILQTLERHDMVQRDPGIHLYRLGPRAAQIGAAALNGLDVRMAARPYMERLRAASGETVALNVRFGDIRVYVEQLESPHELRAKAAFGRPYPLYAGAPGRALLLDEPEDQIDSLLRRVTLQAYTDATPVSAEEVKRRVAEARRIGYAVAAEEVITGLRTVAVPVRDHSNRTVAALSISGPTSRVTEERVGELTKALLDEADLLSRALGFRAR